MFRAWKFAIIMKCTPCYAMLGSCRHSLARFVRSFSTHEIFRVENNWNHHHVYSICTYDSVCVCVNVLFGNAFELNFVTINCDKWHRLAHIIFRICVCHFLILSNHLDGGFCTSIFHCAVHLVPCVCTHTHLYQTKSERNIRIEMFLPPNKQVNGMKSILYISYRVNINVLSQKHMNVE